MLVFDHVGITTTIKQPNEDWIETSRVWVTNPRNHPEQIEFLRYEPDSTVPQVIKDNPHVAFRVDDLAPHMEGQEIIIPPFTVGDFVEVVFIRKHNTIFEYMHYLNDSWFGDTANHELPGNLYLCLGHCRNGVRAAVDEFRSLGLNTVTIAGSYHAGKFLRPHGEAGKVYFPQDGTVYFKPDPSRYGAIKPLPNAMLAEHDVLRELTRQDGIATNVWLVLLHNTPLGTAHPQSTVANAFGDRYVYSLCPSARMRAPMRSALPGRYPRPRGQRRVDGIAWLRALCAWLSSRIRAEPAEPLARQPARALLLRSLHARGESAGINAAGLKKQVAQDVSAYLASDIDFPADMAEAFWLADTRTDGEMSAFLDWRCTVVTSLVAEIRASVRKDASVAVIPSVARPTGGAWYEGSDLAALARGRRHHRGLFL